MDEFRALDVVLLLALFAAIVWWVVSQGWLDPANQRAMAWIVLALLGVTLGVGMSWAHIRRRMSGQASVDRVEGQSVTMPARNSVSRSGIQMSLGGTALLARRNSGSTPRYNI
jgi:Family of unknown function (DUF6524)